MVNIIILNKKCLLIMNYKVISKELVIGFIIIVSSILDLDDKCIESFYYLDNKGCKYINYSKISEIVKCVFKFNEIKFDIRVIKITFDNRNKKMK